MYGSYCYNNNKHYVKNYDENKVRKRSTTYHYHSYLQLKGTLAKRQMSNYILKQQPQTMTPRHKMTSTDIGIVCSYRTTDFQNKGKNMTAKEDKVFTSGGLLAETKAELLLSFI